MKSLLLTFSRPGIAIAALKSGPEDVKIERDLTDLAPERKEKLDLYQPSERAPGTLSPAVVIIHGGGWVEATRVPTTHGRSEPRSSTTSRMW